MLHKEPKNITEDDLNNLVDNSVSEGKTLEFKSKLSLSSEKEKKEFLADFSAFANTDGGDLLFGVAETSGCASGIPGTTVVDEDSELLKIESLLQDSIEPRVQGHKIHALKLANGNHVIIIRIPKSWNAPHRISYNGTEKFYGRNSKGKYSLDVGELRTIFTRGTDASTKVRQFVDSRIAKVRMNEAPIVIESESLLVLHLLPQSTFYLGETIDLSDINNQVTSLKPMNSGSWDHQYNLDGFMTFNQVYNQSYVQVFRFGGIEAVESKILGATVNEDLSIPSTLLEQEILKGVNSYLPLMEKLKVGLPIYCFVTLIGIQNHHFAGHQQFFRNRVGPRKEVLRLRESKIESFEISTSEILKPVFDSLWNAYGFEKSPNFDDQGNWRPR